MLTEKLGEPLTDPHVSTPIAAHDPMREQQDDQQSNQQSRGPEHSAKDRDHKHPRHDTRNDGDSDNPQICRGMD